MMNDIDDDEAIGDMDSMSSSTTTLSAEVYDFIEENGRTYHQHKAGSYLLPNDEIERERLDLQHKLWLLTLSDESLYLAPISEGGMVLDMGTGTGIWAEDFAYRDPAAEVIAIDLSPIQPQWNLSNLRFEIDDLEADSWTFRQKFTFIHGRMLFTCFKNPARVIEQAFHALEPGGYLEFQDAIPRFHYDEGSPKGSAMEMWATKLDAAALKSGRDWSCSFKEYMEEAGFVDIKEVHYKWPINPWPIDEDEKEKGELCLANLLYLQGLEAISMASMTRYLGMSKGEVQEFLALMEKEIKDPNIHADIPVSVVYGRKPPNSRPTTSSSSPSSSAPSSASSSASSSPPST